MLFCGKSDNTLGKLALVNNLNRCREVTVGKEICYVSRVTSVLRVVACLNPGRQIERQTFTLLSGNDIFLRRRTENVFRVLETTLQSSESL